MYVVQGAPTSSRDRTMRSSKCIPPLTAGVPADGTLWQHRLHRRFRVSTLTEIPIRQELPNGVR